MPYRRPISMESWPYTTPGIPDDLFEREQAVPITKEEPRTIQISKARIRTGSTIYDIGCGSGSISVEAALRTGPSGTVHAVDRNIQAVELTQRNVSRFGLRNIDTIHGEAVRIVPSLPAADSIFIGGTGGQTARIMELCRDNMESGRMVIGTILVETLHDVLSTARKMNPVDIDITQIIVQKSRHTSTGTMMLARNPVTIVTLAF